MTPAITWGDVKAGDWIRAESVVGGGGGRTLQGVVEALHENAGEDGLAISINDTRRACVNWSLLEVRAIE